MIKRTLLLILPFILPLTLAGTVLLQPASPASAWDDIGHMMVARLAWEELKPETRRTAIELLKQAPEDALLQQLYPDYQLTGEKLDLIFFERASTWADQARSLVQYHHGNWHYVNRFWEQTDARLPPMDRWDIDEETPNLVQKLYELELQLKDKERPAAERAIDLAWVLHLVGDIHQPLHCSSRVTNRRGERRGDRGGNGFELREVPSDDLHGLWDFIQRQALPQQDGETFPAYLERLASPLRRQSLDAEEALDRNYRTWADEGYLIAKIAVYPPGLVRGQKPPEDYVQSSLVVAQRRIALAGKRLAVYLESALAP